MFLFLFLSLYKQQILLLHTPTSVQKTWVGWPYHCYFAIPAFFSASKDQRGNALIILLAE